MFSGVPKVIIRFSTIQFICLQFINVNQTVCSLQDLLHFLYDYLSIIISIESVYARHLFRITFIYLLG